MKRVLLKLSGEALAKDTNEIYNVDFVEEVAAEIAACAKEGYEIALVVGAGNIWRGRQGGDMDRQDADRMGMLATVINSICLKDAIKRAGVKCEVMSSIALDPFAKQYSKEAAISLLEQGGVVVFGGGLGVPFLSTDTAGAVRAAEICADAMLMAKNIDYIYTADPRVDKDAKRLETIKCSEFLALNLKAIDATAAAFCMSNGMPIRVFGLKNASDITKAIKGETIGTIVTAD